MEIFEKINRAFGGWYEGLFGASDDVRPKDVLRKILVAMEENRKEGFDSRIYVPNQYVLEVAVEDEEEKEYLLSFLDREELETAIRRYCQQNHYEIRGALDFTIKEVERDAEAKKPEKVRVRVRYNSKIAAPPVPEPVAALPVVAYEEENATVYGVSGEVEEGTVAAVALARLEVLAPGKPPADVAVSRGVITIGRSQRSGNDIVLDQDGLASRRHARIELDSDGRFTIYDLDTTNGTRVNGKRIDNRTLGDGDEIQIGATRLVFHQESHDSNGANPRAASGRVIPGGRRARLVLLDGEREVEDYVLATETVIGRGATNDIVLPDRSVATWHARVRRGEPFTLESLDSESATSLNGAQVEAGASVPMQPGDRVGIGALLFRFEGDAV